MLVLPGLEWFGNPFKELYLALLFLFAPCFNKNVIDFATPSIRTFTFATVFISGSFQTFNWLSITGFPYRANMQTLQVKLCVCVRVCVVNQMLDFYLTPVTVTHSIPAFLIHYLFLSCFDSQCLGHVSLPLYLYANVIVCLFVFL